jgi:Ni,Fe-hydrogenase III large subunit
MSDVVNTPPGPGRSAVSPGTVVRSGQLQPFETFPALTPDAFSTYVRTGVRAGGRLVGVWGWPAEDGMVHLLAVLAVDATGRLTLCRAMVPAGTTFPSLTPHVPAAQAFEREIFESLGLRPAGHPWLKPLLRHAELEGQDGGGGGHEFFCVDGPGIHEVAVGPVHAGIIEPGHFRFQCSGETVLHLEIQLGYQYRGAQALLLKAAPARRLVVAESIAGDTVIGHATAYCEALEALAGAEVPPRAQALRAIALELERVANHVGDLGALCGDVAYLPGAAYLGRLRGELLNLLLELSGNRFGRGLLVPGGVRFDLDEPLRADFGRRLASAQRDFEEVADLVFSEPSVLSRFEQAGPLSPEATAQLGLVGPVARASGCTRDVRVDHPSGFYRFAHIPVAHLEGGDVFARAMVRQIEARRSLTFVREEIERLPKGALATPVGALAASALTVTLVEAWRGEIAHLAVTDAHGLLCSYQIADPSLHNWLGLAMAMRGQQISDFPLCNKSFNLSYAGHDR